MIEPLINSSGPFLITFKEALEAVLIVGILTAYLKKIGRIDLKRYVILGTVGAYS